MKPVVIYTLARTKSTATLMSCRRDFKYNEPFSFSELSLYSTTITSQAWWDSFHLDFDNPNSVTKLFGSNLATCPYARPWFKRLDEKQTHDVFVLIRDPREICFSYLLALLFGFSKAQEKEPSSLEVKEEHLFQLFFEFDGFFRFLPANRKVVTFDTLPVEYFDKSLIPAGRFHIKRDIPKTSAYESKEQNSLEKISRIENLDYVNKRVDELLEMFAPNWAALKLETW